MSKRPVQVTLSNDNLLWLREQAIASGHRSLSKTLDELIRNVRTSGDAKPRSVIGAIEINPSDPDLLEADSFIKSTFRKKTRYLTRKARKRSAVRR